MSCTPCRRPTRDARGTSLPSAHTWHTIQICMSTSHCMYICNRCHHLSSIIELTSIAISFIVSRCNQVWLQIRRRIRLSAVKLMPFRSLLDCACGKSFISSWSLPGQICRFRLLSVCMYVCMCVCVCVCVSVCLSVCLSVSVCLYFYWLDVAVNFVIHKIWLMWRCLPSLPSCDEVRSRSSNILYLRNFIRIHGLLATYHTAFNFIETRTRCDHNWLYFNRNLIFII